MIIKLVEDEGIRKFEKKRGVGVSYGERKRISLW